jgi:hypothetical protein
MLATVYNERFAEHGFNGCFPVCAQLTSKQAPTSLEKTGKKGCNYSFD